MSNTLRTVRYTGNSYLKNKLFGGVTIMIEVVSYYIDDNGSCSPNFTHYRKATEKDLVEILKVFKTNNR